MSGSGEYRESRKKGRPDRQGDTWTRTAVIEEKNHQWIVVWNRKWNRRTLYSRADGREDILMGVAQPLHTMDAENQDYMMLSCGRLVEEVLWMGDTELGNTKNAEAAKRRLDQMAK